ncbi:MAG TPA: hypothetical protein GXZ38_06000 [Spirochaetales bacterium]|jgi:hypothetical protein|nr:hypothetical protein [Spirochaetales bacterium]
MIGRRAIIAQRSYRGHPPPQMDPPTALRYDISLAILLITIKKVLTVISTVPKQRRKAA